MYSEGFRSASGLRRGSLNTLTDSEINHIKSEIASIRADERVFLFNIGARTSYDDKADKIYVRGDVFPNFDSMHPRDLMSERAVLAHEYYGHRAFKGTMLDIGSWNDEFRASYTAAKVVPALSDDDKRYLIQDAIERARVAGISIKHNAFIRRVLYGY